MDTVPAKSGEDVNATGRKGGTASYRLPRESEFRRKMISGTAAHYNESALEAFRRDSPAASVLQSLADVEGHDSGD